MKGIAWLLQANPSNGECGRRRNSIRVFSRIAISCVEGWPGTNTQLAILEKPRPHSMVTSGGHDPLPDAIEKEQPMGLPDGGGDNGSNATLPSPLNKLLK